MLNREALQTLAGAGSQILPTKDGQFTIRTEKGYIHSLYSPVKEAERLIEPLMELDRLKTLVVLLGAGLGYVPDLLEKKGFENVIIIEQDFEVFSIFERVYQCPPHYFKVTPQDMPDKLDSIFSMLEIQSIRSIKTIVLRGGYRKELYQAFEDRLERLLKRNLRISSRKGSPRIVPTTEPTTPVVRANAPERPRKLTARMSTI